MMKKPGMIVFALLVLSGVVTGQAAKSIYVELGGPGLASINFDTRFSNMESGIGGRIGLGGFTLSDDVTVLFIPVGINYLLGRDEKNYFELGAGVTPVFGSTSLDDENFSSTFGHLSFGYRLQPKKGGFTFRAFINPLFGGFGFIPYWAGISFGYKF